MYHQLIVACASVGAIALAEMGDKTQLLAMAFAVRYKSGKVMLGIFLATVINHALAVAVGSFIARFALLDAIVQAVAAVSFVLFGLWTLHGDTLEGEQEKASRFGPVMTVAVAFFLAEMGDKTQLATLALSARFPDVPALVLLGTTTGMLLADGFGIVFGVLLCRRIPEKQVKLGSAAVFALFGFLAVGQVCRGKFGFSAPATAGVVAGVVAATAAAAAWLLKHQDARTGYAGVAELNACSADEADRT